MARFYGAIALFESIACQPGEYNCHDYESHDHRTVDSEFPLLLAPSDLFLGCPQKDRENLPQGFAVALAPRPEALSRPSTEIRGKWIFEVRIEAFVKRLILRLSNAHLMIWAAADKNGYNSILLKNASLRVMSRVDLDFFTDPPVVVPVGMWRAYNYEKPGFSECGFDLPGQMSASEVIHVTKNGKTAGGKKFSNLPAQLLVGVVPFQSGL